MNCPNNMNHLKFTDHAKIWFNWLSLGHSFSKNYFNQKFESEKIDATYLNFEIPNIQRSEDRIKREPGIERSECHYPLQGTSHSLLG